jgi:hypothetical protein
VREREPGAAGQPRLSASPESRSGAAYGLCRSSLPRVLLSLATLCKTVGPEASRACKVCDPSARLKRGFQPHAGLSPRSRLPARADASQYDYSMPETKESIGSFGRDLAATLSNSGVS